MTELTTALLATIIHIGPHNTRSFPKVRVRSLEDRRKIISSKIKASLIPRDQELTDFLIISEAKDQFKKKQTKINEMTSSLVKPSLTLANQDESYRYARMKYLKIVYSKILHATFSPSTFYPRFLYYPFV